MEPHNKTSSSDHSDLVCTVINSYRYFHGNEDGLQVGIMTALLTHGLPAVREVHLNLKDRVDILVGDVGVEVKVRGGVESLLRQLQRYATHDRIGALVVVTTMARHRALPTTVGGKPVRVIHLGGTA